MESLQINFYICVVMLGYLSLRRADKRRRCYIYTTQVALPDPRLERVQVAVRCHNTFWLILKWLFSKSTVCFFCFWNVRWQGGPTVGVLLIACLQLWQKCRDGIDKYWILPVTKFFHFRHWYSSPLSKKRKKCIVLTSRRLAKQWKQNNWKSCNGESFL